MNIAPYLRKACCVLPAFLLISISSAAQDSLSRSALSKPRNFDRAAVGIGIGQDYGGMIGMNLTIYPQKYVGIFAGGGYLYGEFGYNAGLKFRFFAADRAVPAANFFFTAMYGYTAAIRVKNAAELDKTFYGATVGLGFDTRYNPKKNTGYWSFGLLVPIREPEVDAYIRGLRKQGVKINSLWPVTISVGYRMVLN